MSRLLLATTFLLPAALLLWALCRPPLRRWRVRFIAVGAVAALVAVLIQQWYPPVPPLVLTNVAVLAAAAAIGWLIGGTSAGAPGLMAVLVAASMIDVYSYYFGATGSLLSSSRAAEIVPYVALTAPGVAGLRVLIGLGDLAFVAAFYHHTPPVGQRFGWLANLIPVLALEAAIFTSLTWRPVPAIPFLAAGFALMLALRRHARLRAHPERGAANGMPGVTPPLKPRSQS